MNNEKPRPIIIALYPYHIFLLFLLHGLGNYFEYFSFNAFSILFDEIFMRNPADLSLILVKEVLVLIDGILSIAWESPSASAFCKDDDKATIIVYNPAKQEFVTFQDIARRDENKVDLQLPENFSGCIPGCIM